MTFSVAVEPWRLAMALVGLVLFGVLYDIWVSRLEHQGHDRGYMSFIVALGCVATISGVSAGTFSWEIGVLMLAGFAASGVPMVVGSVRRYIQARDSGRETGNYPAQPGEVNRAVQQLRASIADMLEALEAMEQNLSEADRHARLSNLRGEIVDRLVRILAERIADERTEEARQ